MLTTKIKPQFLQANWAAPANIKTLITAANPEFNLASHVGDDQEQVRARREILNKHLPSSPLWLNQVHGIEVVDWRNPAAAAPPDADASFSTANNQVCVIMTADCLPILLSNRRGDFVAAVHAGWRGLQGGILAATLARLANFPSAEMLAFIGPAICQKCFEIGGEVRSAFLTSDPETAAYFLPGQTTAKFQADLRRIATHQLRKLGVPAVNISNSNICTKCASPWFYSYRANPQTGRFATLIWKTPQSSGA